jgi:Leucine-rich repeat (LRR) protein
MASVSSTQEYDSEYNSNIIDNASIMVNEYINSFPLDTTEIDISNRGLSYLPDLTRFTHLQKLKCSKNKITTLPTLPSTLKTLLCSNNKLTSLPLLPDNLEDLWCVYNKLSSLPPLPDKLQVLNCSYNKLKFLPPLNDNLESLNCAYNKLTFLPPLNSVLDSLYCNNNHLLRLPKLNDNLQELDCYTNCLTRLPKLNDKLRLLDCVNNRLRSIPPLNDSLQHLDCSYNRISNLPDLNELLYFQCFSNPISAIISNTQDILIAKKNVKTLNKFRNLFYSLKYKNKLRRMLWENIREKNVMVKYSPDNLEALLSQVEDEEFQEVLDTW